MCIGDWRAGRFIRTVSGIRTVNPGNDVIIAASPQRVGILFAPNLAAAIAPALVELIVGGAPVHTFVDNGLSVSFNMIEFGDLPTKQFVMRAFIGGPYDIGVHEMFLTEEFLNAGTEQWQQILLGNRR